MKIRAYAKTDVGRKRESNEDAILVEERLGLYIVADGMGGHMAGDVASKMAVETIRDAIASDPKIVGDIREGRASHDVLQLVAARAVDHAGKVVFNDAWDNFERSGMGCALTMLLVSGSKAAMVHVGDTSLYLVRDDRVERLSISHTHASDLVRAGLLTKDAEETSTYSHVLTRSLGTHEMVESDRLILDFLPGDVFILCSDGLFRYLESSDELNWFVSTHDPTELPARLIEAANERGGKDNISVVVLAVEASEAEQEDASHIKTTVRDALAVLQKVEFFKDLSLANRIRILNSAERVTVQEHMEAVPRGRDLEALHIVLAGTGRMTWPDGTHKTLSAGDTFGWEALFHTQPLGADIRAETRLRLLRIDGKRFRDLVRRRPWLGVVLQERLCARLSREVETVRRRGSTAPRRGLLSIFGG